MGLTISRLEGMTISWSYLTLHMVRWLAARSCGYKGTREDFGKVEHTTSGGRGTTWARWPDYYQLMHFSDVEGALLPEHYLDFNYKKSFSVGSFDKFVDEIVRLWGWLNVHKNDESLALQEWEIEAVRNLYELVSDKDGLAIINFR